MTSEPVNHEHEPPEPELATARSRLGDRFRRLTCMLAENPNLRVHTSWQHNSGHEAAWYSTKTGQITLNGQHATGDEHPDLIDPCSPSGRLAHPRATGACAHGVAHARHTAWPSWGLDPTIASRAASLLEEPRAEARYLRHRPNDRLYLRTVAVSSTVPILRATHEDGDATWRAGMLAALVLARVDAGLFARDETDSVQRACRDVLGLQRLKNLRHVWLTALHLDDGDVTGLCQAGQEWVDILGIDEGEADHTPGVSCVSDEGEPDTATTTTAGDAAPCPENGTLDEAVAQLEQHMTASLDENDASENSGTGSPAGQEHRSEETQRRDTETQQRKHAKQQAEATFAPEDGNAERGNRVLYANGRKPTSEERAMVNMLASVFRRAQFRERSKHVTPSTTPPGRLIGREAMLSTAQRSLGMPVTAKPYRQIRHEHATQPPLTVGIAVDISPSMRWCHQITASTAWITAHATHRVGGTTAGVLYDDEITPLINPTAPPSRIPEFRMGRGDHHLADALHTLDGALALSSPGSARVLLVISDGNYDHRRGQIALDRLRRSGVTLLWLNYSSTYTPMSGVTWINLEDPADMPGHVSGALEYTLRHTNI